MRRVKQNRKTRTRQIDRFQLYKLSDLHYFNITFLGIVCPYPETPFFRQLAKEGRILPNTVSRDYDGYTLSPAARVAAG